MPRREWPPAIRRPCHGRGYGVTVSLEDFA